MLRISLVVAVAFAASAAAHAQTAKPDLQRGSQIVQQTCVACHGSDGNSAAPANPKLASQHPEYLAKQLHDFKPAGDAGKAARPSPIMSAFAAPLTEADIRDVSAFFASQALKPSAAANKEWVELGQRIYRAGIAEKGVPGCAGCHSPNGAGIPSQYPRLAGQFAQYTEAQLVAFRSGDRGNSVQMTQIAARLSDLEIKAVSDYVAGLR
jgi:cytochrome c553